MELIIRIADYILRDSQKVRKGFGKVMGGKVLELESDKLADRFIQGKNYLSACFLKVNVINFKFPLNQMAAYILLLRCFFPA